jgi:hypothetical protein
MLLDCGLKDTHSTAEGRVAETGLEAKFEYDGLEMTFSRPGILV